jgi:hypothetical protein
MSWQPRQRHMQHTGELMERLGARTEAHID